MPVLFPMPDHTPLKRYLAYFEEVGVCVCVCAHTEDLKIGRASVAVVHPHAPACIARVHKDSLSRAKDGVVNVLGTEDATAVFAKCWQHKIERRLIWRVWVLTPLLEDLAGPSKPMDLLYLQFSKAVESSQP